MPDETRLTLIQRWLQQEDEELLYAPDGNASAIPQPPLPAPTCNTGLPPEYVVGAQIGEAMTWGEFQVVLRQGGYTQADLDDLQQQIRAHCERKRRERLGIYDQETLDAYAHYVREWNAAHGIQEP